VIGQPGTYTRDVPIDLPEATSLPVCELERVNERLIDHGARVLIFIFETGCTATLSDRELEHADRAAHYAIIARGILPAAADRISDVRHQILATLRARRPAASSKPEIIDGGQLTGKLGIGGPGDREPLQPKPYSRPPAGMAIDIQF